MSEDQEHRPRLASADSTFLEPPAKKMKKKKKKHSSAHETNTTRYSVKHGGDEVTISPHLSPLVHYVHNRTELLEQVFDILSESDLKRILPSSLRSTGLEELKEICLHHLKRVSEKRLLSIIAGEHYESDHHIEETEEESKATQNTEANFEDALVEPVVSSSISELPPPLSVSNPSNATRLMSVNVGGEEDNIEIMVEDDSLDDGNNKDGHEGASGDNSHITEQSYNDDVLQQVMPKQSEKQLKGKKKIVEQTRSQTKVTGMIDDNVPLSELEMRKKALRSELKKEEVVSKQDNQAERVSPHAPTNKSQPKTASKAKGEEIDSTSAERAGSKKDLLAQIEQRQKELLMLRQRTVESMITLCKNQKQGKMTKQSTRKK
ncbi:caspase activity and apoptosis inhibitor 1-like [Corticium candelabrum]|uniref:caspase activity and apoptosis inhibitor 1-like n=1 Tax=Corticium candelabrum TaxID=121492 RepID=UPI002E25D76E|nr:caspase activity and apoptosis inhibitor 1-like [Corticium candelabrum]